MCLGTLSSGTEILTETSAWVVDSLAESHVRPFVHIHVLFCVSFTTMFGHSLPCFVSDWEGSLSTSSRLRMKCQECILLYSDLSSAQTKLVAYPFLAGQM